MSKWKLGLLVSALGVGALAIGAALLSSGNQQGIESLASRAESLSERNTGSSAVKSAPTDNPAARSPEKARSSSSSSASSDALFVSEYKTLSARAQRGDSAAASKLFLDSEKCLRARRIIRQVEKVVRDSEFRRNDPEVNVTPESLAAGEQSLAEWKAQLDAANESSVLCDGSDTILSDSAVFAIRLQAAGLGDSDAAACYVRGQTQNTRYAQLDGFTVEYLANAAPIVDARIKAGDWRIVRLMLAASDSRFWHLRFRGGSPLLLERLAKHEPAGQYRYLKLLSFAETRPEELTWYRETLNWKASQMKSGDVVQADDWAAKTYANYFRSNENFLAQGCPE